VRVSGGDRAGEREYDTAADGLGQEMRARVAQVLLVGLVLGMVGCDHATKGLAESHLRDQEPVDVVSGVVELRYVQNHGSAFGVDRVLPPPARTPAILLGVLLGVGALLVMWRRHARRPSWQQVAFAMILAGAVGNLLDRIFRGYVVDFIHVQHWPVFNVADVCIFVGVALLALTWKRSLQT
jgi:signal peptidase II